METKLFDQDHIAEAAAVLAKGGLVAFPTETVYGLGASALLPDAVAQVYQVKGRPSDNPLIVHVAAAEQVAAFVDNLSPMAKQLMDTFWPGPLTLIFKIKPDSLPSIVTGGLTTAAFRMPDHPQTLALISQAQQPLVGPSANTSGKPSPTSAAHVWHDLHGKIAGILDGGATRIGVESTVLDLSDPSGTPIILRPGAIAKEQLETVLETEVLLDKHLVSAGEVPKAPGMKYKHYAPNTKVMMVHDTDWPAAINWAQANHFKVGVLAGPTIAEAVRKETAAIYQYFDDSPEAAARGLFAGLRALDESTAALDLLLAATFTEAGIGAAYMNRLKKAANHEYFQENK
ncbi:Sua5/YciO/YrdC/YwlC family tRNA threonylcarbamoyl adenosine modification protein [Enterococcus sp. 8G7_MSG3316]|uniref:Threonylcarbamoyl-AMP synthase n=1 Tax=Candidatus Enterococcus testudinis TaxID=1834191 RepID=A0A242AAE2_9ENTE|nr:L-threonylcarbamoyladenylate synthase [Enterococcus sp. 8G7_MSG3316]OTN77691.1 Sua5/YciO/YrdC/YwlC family tRNA threonylcarbamoyl adenosine modification protein [Enterococcus sp. 8G7_MSG3316]